MQKKDYSLKSGERYSTLDLNLIGGDHLLRYKYAANRAKEIYASPYGADIFCGSGYGAEILAETTQGNILAIDGSLEAIENASNKILSPNIIWAAKLFPFNLPKNTFDFITSMESLEHVKDFEAFFWVLSQSLKIGGTLFISSPHEKIMPYNGYIWHYKHLDRKSTRLNSSHLVISYAVFCLKKKNMNTIVLTLVYEYQPDSVPMIILNDLKGDSISSPLGRRSVMRRAALHS